MNEQHKTELQQSEQQKMLTGLPYDASDPLLLKQRLRAKTACHQFNHAEPSLLEQSMESLRELIKFAGRAHIEPNIFCDYGYNIHIGDNFYANHNLVIIDVCEVDIGCNVMFGPNVMISTATHPLDPIERQKTEYGVPIKIGNNVWLGANVAVLPGVSIGDNCVIGAGSVVNRDIHENSVAVGNPCRVIKQVPIIGKD